MFKNHFTIVLRNLTKRKSYTFINVLGLSVGVATTLLIFLVIRYECTYDEYNSKKERIHRVVTTYSNRSNGEVTGRNSAVPIMLADALRNDASRRVLNIQLNELEEHELIVKTIYPVMPPKVEYDLTDFGHSLMPIIHAIGIWGDENHERLRTTILNQLDRSAATPES